MKVKRKLNKTNLILSILLVISASLLIYSIVNIKNWKKDNDSTEEEIKSIYKTVSVEEVTDGETVNSENQKKESIYWSYIKMNMINVDFTDLIKQNKDTKGWIQVNGTNINYPFVQSNDNAYYLNHSFNKKKNEIDPSPYSIELTCTSSIATINEHVLLAENEGTAIIHAKLLYNNNEVDNKVYNIMFLNNAKPDYETYGEPNVHHLLVKTAKTYEELLNNFNYLCVNELCWCIENNSLYIKIKASNGSLVLFKINGDSASEIPITFKYNDGYVEIDDNNKELVYVDSDGYINILPSTIDEDGYIILNDIATNN